MNSKKKKMLILLGIVLVFAVCLAVGIWAGRYYADRASETVPQEGTSQADNNTVYFDGKPYEYNSNIRNILFLGIDNDAEMTEYDVLGTAGQADCIMLLSIDREKGTTQLMQISRDTMTEVDLLDVYGSVYSTMDAQIAVQYAFGNGMETSCRAMKKTVSELLYELPIYGYFAMDIAAIPVLNDLVGGVEITIPEDYTEVDPAFVQGATLTLTGEQAEKYVRYRDTNVFGSNNLRMQRQIQYIPALFHTIEEKVGLTEEAFDQYYSVMSPFIVTDLTADEMAEMMQYGWDLENITYLPGESVAGENFEEFHINDVQLKEILLQSFYELK